MNSIKLSGESRIWLQSTFVQRPAKITTVSLESLVQILEKFGISTMAAANLQDNNFKLTYFNAQGFAEPIRWIFHYFGIPFEDNRLEWNYPKFVEEEKEKYRDSVGQIPVLEFDSDDGRRVTLAQSQVISRYLANELGFGGETNLERARVDEVINMVFDLINLWRTMFNFGTESEPRAFWKKMADDKFPLYYEYFEKAVVNSGGDYVAGSKLTHADFWLAVWIDILEGPITDDMILPVMPPNTPVPCAADYKEGMAAAGYPKLAAHKERIKNLPQIQAWIQKRPKTII